MHPWVGVLVVGKEFGCASVNMTVFLQMSRNKSILDVFLQMYLGHSYVLISTVYAFMAMYISGIFSL